MQVLPQWLFFYPEPPHTAASKPSGYNMTCRGVARQGEDGRPHHHLISLISLISLMQASHHRRQHTAVAIKLPAYPTVTLRPRHTTLRQSKPTGYNETHPPSSYKSYKSYESYASVATPQHAYRRCHQVARHTQR